MGNDLLPLEHFGISVCICADALYFYKYKHTKQILRPGPCNLFQMLPADMEAHCPNFVIK